MDNNIKEIVKHLHNSRYYPTYVIVGVNIILLVITLFVGFKVYDQYMLKQSVDIDLENAKESVKLIRDTQTQLAPKIDEYNATLEKLIPDQESYFQVISALEQLSAKTGIQIISYSIDLKSTTEQKLSLSIEMDGDQQVIENLLRDYTFTSGRLLTNEKASISYSGEGTLNFTLNFYHKEYDESADVGGQQINPKDIQYVEEIQSKLN